MIWQQITKAKTRSSSLLHENKILNPQNLQIIYSHMTSFTAGPKHLQITYVYFKRKWIIYGFFKDYKKFTGT